jgi:hypothetical protein
MTSTVELPIPKSKRITGFWLAALLLGSTPIFIYNLFDHHGFMESMVLTVAITLCTALFSLPSLLLLCLVVPWALASPSLVQRWLRLVAVQCTSAGITSWLIHLTILDNHIVHHIPAIASSYFVAGLLAAYWCYSTWLTR